MQIKINGEPRDVPSSISLRELIDTLALAPQRIAVEVNKMIVPRAKWESTGLKDGDQIEIVHFVGGGTERWEGSANARRSVVGVLDNAVSGVEF